MWRKLLHIKKIRSREMGLGVNVRRLREKIEADPANPAYILTRRGAGYYFAV